MIKRKNRQDKRCFYGSTNIGERGQVVVPVDARKNMKLGKGERLLVFGMGKDMLALVKLSRIEQIAWHLSKKLKMIDEVMRKAKRK